MNKCWREGKVQIWAHFGVPYTQFPPVYQQRIKGISGSFEVKEVYEPVLKSLMLRAKKSDKEWRKKGKEKQGRAMREDRREMKQ